MILTVQQFLEQLAVAEPSAAIVFVNEWGKHESEVSKVVCVAPSAEIRVHLQGLDLDDLKNRVEDAELDAATANRSLENLKTKAKQIFDTLGANACADNPMLAANIKALYV